MSLSDFREPESIQKIGTPMMSATNAMAMYPSDLGDKSCCLPTVVNLPSLPERLCHRHDQHKDEQDDCRSGCPFMVLRLECLFVNIIHQGRRCASRAAAGHDVLDVERLER